MLPVYDFQLKLKLVASDQSDIMLKVVPHVSDGVLGLPSELPGSATLCIDPTRVFHI